MIGHYEPISRKGRDDQDGTIPCEEVWSVAEETKLTKVTINHERVIVEFSRNEPFNVPFNQAERVVITQMDGPHLKAPPILVSTLTVEGMPLKANVFAFADDNRMSKIDVVAGKVTCYGTWPIPVEIALDETVTVIAEFV